MDAKIVSRKQRWLRRLQIDGTAYCLIVLLIWWGHGADFLILRPSPMNIDPVGAVRQMIKVGGDDVELWLARSPGTMVKPPVAYVLFFVGNADRADRWATFYAASWGSNPVEVVGVNYPGYGGSTGPRRLAKIGPSALAAYDFVVARAQGAASPPASSAKNVHPPIFLMANSIGTTAALRVLAQRDSAGAVLISPPPLQRLILQHHGWWNLWLLAGPVAMAIPSDLNSPANAAQSKAPAVFVLSEKDEIVPVAYQRMVYDAYAGEKRLIDLPNASHNAGMDQAAWDEVGRGIAWLLEKAPREK